MRPLLTSSVILFNNFCTLVGGEASSISRSISYNGFSFQITEQPGPTGFKSKEDLLSEKWEV